MKNKFFASLLAMLLLVNVGAPAIASASGENEPSLMEEYQTTLPQLSESEMLKGATVLEENKVKNVPLMKAYQEDIVKLAEDRGFDLPPEAQKYNPDTIYDLDSIAPRIKLLGLTGIFIHRCSTELIYKVQAAHSKAAAEVTIALVTAFNPFASNDDIEAASERISNVMDELVQMPDLTADDFATIYLKKVFNKDVREAKKLLNNYYRDDLSEVGVKGKREFVRNSLAKEINDVSKQGNSQIQVKTLIELDARLKSACQAALLERDVYASPKWLSGTIDREINDTRAIKNKTNKYLTADERNTFEKELRKSTDVRRAKGVSYSRAAEGVYILRDYVNELRAKHPQEFEAALALREGEPIAWRDFNVQSEIPDPARIAKIIWLNSPSFDFLPDGFKPSDNEEIIVGYGNSEDKLQYGSYETYVNNRDRLRASEEVVAPDFGDEEENNNQTPADGYLIFNFK